MKTRYPKGNGIIKCGGCGKPLAKHEGFGPCPDWVEGLVKNPDEYKDRRGYKRRNQ